MNWISVKDRLPDDESNILAVIPYDGVFCTPFSCCFTNRRGFYCPDDGDHIDKSWSDSVTHWMPLPDPPKNDPLP